MRCKLIYDTPYMVYFHAYASVLQIGATCIVYCVDQYSEYTDVFLNVLAERTNEYT